MVTLRRLLLCLRTGVVIVVASVVVTIAWFKVQSPALLLLLLLLLLSHCGKETIQAFWVVTRARARRISRHDGEGEHQRRKVKDFEDESKLKIANAFWVQ